LLHPEISIREDVRTRFLREGYVANSVKHPGAVRVVDDDVAEDGAAFLVMELLEGSTVEDLCDRCGGRMPLDAAVAIMDQLLEVLSAAHAKSIVHRDIKPANLFVTREATLKVLDFGIARARDAAATSPQGGTGTGMLLGTPAFMAPEQANAKSSEIDSQTDVWAAGATLFTLLTGRMVHDGDNGPQLLIAAATTPARSLALVAPETPAPVVDVVDRALAYRKADRWASAEAMRQGLMAAWKTMTGELPSRVSLAPFFAQAGDAAESDGPATAFAPTRPGTPPENNAIPYVAPAITPPIRETPPDSATQRSRSPEEEERQPVAGRLGGTTARPVSGPSPSEEASPPVPKHRGPVIGAIAVVSAVAIGAAGWGLFALSRSGPGPLAAGRTEGSSALISPPVPKALPTLSLVDLPATGAASLAPPSTASAPPAISTKMRAAPGASVAKPSASTSASGLHGIPIQW
jgi:serine/threonine-protein kinase